MTATGRGRHSAGTRRNCLTDHIDWMLSWASAMQMPVGPREVLRPGVLAPFDSIQEFTVNISP